MPYILFLFLFWSEVVGHLPEQKILGMLRTRSRMRRILTVCGSGGIRLLPTLSDHSEAPKIWVGLLTNGVTCDGKPTNFSGTHETAFL